MLNKRIIYYLIATIGVVLMVLGIANHQYGAFIVGLIVAAINIRGLRRLTGNSGKE